MPPSDADMRYEPPAGRSCALAGAAVAVPLAVQVKRPRLAVVPLVPALVVTVTVTVPVGLRPVLRRR